MSSVQKIESERVKYMNVYSVCGIYMTSDVTTIRVHHSTRDRLREMGKKDESYEDIILRLLDGLNKTV